jgi:uncharacterized protein with GYD domain
MIRSTSATIAVRLREDRSWRFTCGKEPTHRKRGPLGSRTRKNRIETAARPACEAAGGRLIGGWYSFGEYDVVIVADVPNNQSMSAVAMAVGSGGHLKASKTTVLMTGTEGVEAMRQAGSVAAAFTPAR